MTDAPHLLCPYCRYSLRGLAEPRCPECGEHFEWKRAVDLDAEFGHMVRQMRASSFWALAMWAMFGAVTVLNTAIERKGDFYLSRPLLVVLVVVMFFFAIMSVSNLLGCAWLYHQDRRHLIDERRSRLKRLFIFALMALLGPWVVVLTVAEAAMRSAQ